jgi:hypothetical protein
MPEDIQEIGRQGAATLKRWLEATTYVELPFDAYNNKIDCSFQTFGKPKQFDLVGFMVEGERIPVIIECKRYTSPGRQYQEFMKFLAIAYATTAKELETYHASRKPTFYWVTFHPFNLDNWTKLETYDHIKLALSQHPEYVKGHTVNDSLAHDIAARITVLVFNPKQEKLSLTRSELETIRPYLGRKAVTL